MPRKRRGRRNPFRLRLLSRRDPKARPSAAAVGVAGGVDVVAATGKSRTAPTIRSRLRRAVATAARTVRRHRRPHWITQRRGLRSRSASPCRPLRRRHRCPSPAKRTQSGHRRLAKGSTSARKTEN
jgi:hypothetical protein